MITSNTIIDRIKSMSKALSILLKITRIACFIGIGVYLSALILRNVDPLIFKGKVIIYSPFEISNAADMNFVSLVKITVIKIIPLILISQLLWQAQSIFKDISVDSSPFETKHVKRIKYIAILLLIISLLDFDTSAVSIMSGLNLVGNLGAFMFWCIALVFEYGCILQKESDEIL